MVVIKGVFCVVLFFFCFFFLGGGRGSESVGVDSDSQIWPGLMSLTNPGSKSNRSIPTCRKTFIKVDQ